MAKNKTVKSLEMIPAVQNASPAGAMALFQPAASVAIPKNAKKLTLPPLLKPEMIPVGSVVSAQIVALANSISGRADMRESKLIHLRHENGTEFLLPLTGVIKKAVGGDEGIKNNVGKTLIVQRQSDGETMKYCAKGEPAKKVFMFDVYLSE